MLLNNSSHQALIDQLSANGYVFIPNYQAEFSAEQVAQALGKPLTPWVGGLVQELIPRISSTPNTYSGIYGLNSFPFHTDLAHWKRPPRYLLLRCLIGYSEVPTLLLDGHKVFTPQMRNVLTRAIFKPRRPHDGKISLLRLCEPVGDNYCFRWDETFLMPASPIGEIAREGVIELISNSSPLKVSLVHAGDTLLIDNWRMLHARSLVPACNIDRKIQRIYLEGLH